MIDGGWHGINKKSKKSESFLASKVSMMLSTYQKADEVRRQTSDYDQQKITKLTMTRTHTGPYLGIFIRGPYLGDRQGPPKPSSYAGNDCPIHYLQEFPVGVIKNPKRKIIPRKSFR